MKYHTTNAESDHLRGLLTLKTEALFIYELLFDDEQVKRDIEQLSLFKDESRDSASTVSKNKQDDVEVVKLQKFCLMLYDRVVRLEEQLISLNSKGQ